MEKNIANMSVRDLMRWSEELERALEHREPLLFPQYRLVRHALENIDRSPEKPYAEVRYPRAAILLCLKRNGKWMTRRQIRRDLEVGGFRFDPETFDNLLAAALRYHTSTGKLARREEGGTIIKQGHHKLNTRFRNEEFGLAEWVKAHMFESLKEIC